MEDSEAGDNGETKDPGLGEAPTGVPPADSPEIDDQPGGSPETDNDDEDVEPEAGGATDTNGTPDASGGSI